MTSVPGKIHSFKLHIATKNITEVSCGIQPHSHRCPKTLLGIN